jgi:flagellin FlaB
MSESETEMRAQTGISTLILLIAAILVSVMAVGVFFETTGFLEEKTAETGDESLSQITDRIEILGISGHVSANETIETVNITMEMTSDGASLDSHALLLTWIGPNGSARITYAGGANQTAATYGVRFPVDQDTSEPVLNSGDVMILTLNPGTGMNATTTTTEGDRLALGTTGPALEPGETVRLSILTPDGSTLTTDIQVPRYPSPNGTTSL